MAKTNNVHEIKPSSNLEDGRIRYKFKCGIEAYQEELDLRQDELLTEILVDFNLENFSFENTKIRELIQVLVKEKVLSKVMNIILIPVNDDECDFLKLKNSELQAVFSDFFSLNPTVISWLRNIGKNLISSSPIQSTKSSSGT